MSLQLGNADDTSILVVHSVAASCTVRNSLYTINPVVAPKLPRPPLDPGLQLNTAEKSPLVTAVSTVPALRVSLLRCTVASLYMLLLVGGSACSTHCRPTYEQQDVQAGNFRCHPVIALHAQLALSIATNFGRYQKQSLVKRHGQTRVKLLHPAGTTESIRSVRRRTDACGASTDKHLASCS